MHLFRSSIIQRSKYSRSVSPELPSNNRHRTTPNGARFRKRHTDDTLLPLHNHNTPTTISTTTARKNHSNFLYGGNYYPENSNSRQRRRRKIHGNDPAWKRIFCSSPLRMLVTLLILTYSFIRYGIWPGLLLVIEKQASFHGNTILRGNDLLLHLSSESLATMEALRTAILQQQSPSPLSSSTRSDFLQQMYPQFYHRNDNSVSNNKNKPLRTLLAQDHDRPHCSPDEQELQVTLIVQTTLQRLPVLHETCRRWKSSPMIVVVALEDPSFATQQLESYDCPNVQWILYHLTQLAADYPVNRLRNLALEAVMTSHVLMIDVDFVPSDGLDEIIVQSLPSLLNNKQAMVVPAFERIHECSNSHNGCLQHYLQPSNNSSFLPRTMEELDTCVQQTHDCRVFQANNNPDGHSSTHSEEWLLDRNNSDNTSLRPIECFDSLRYEPYLVLPWCGSQNNNKAAAAVPYYDERFHGYGKNKIQHVQHVRFLGFSFVVLPPHGFLVHAPHRDSAAKDEWNHATRLHRDMDELYKEFVHELVDQSREQLDEIVGPCKS